MKAENIIKKNWDIFSISIPVYDLDTSVNFYNHILNSNSKMKITSNTGECFIEGGDIKLRLFELKTDLKNKKIPQSRRTFLTMMISNFEEIIEHLNLHKVDYYKLECNSNTDIETIVIQEPSLNFIELINSKHVSKNQKINYNWRFHHINLESYDVRSSVKFLAHNLKIKEGVWLAPEKLGDVNIKNNQLAIFPLNEHHAGIHVNKADFTFNWRNNFLHNPTIGGHPAFQVDNINEFLRKLKNSNIPFTDAKIYAMPNIYQVYLFDPNANIIEVNQNVLK